MRTQLDIHTVSRPRLTSLPLLGLGFSMLLALGGIASADPIQVDSTAWGDDQNNATCTLWEAVTAVENGGDFGGCAWSGEGEAVVELQAGATYTTWGQLPSITGAMSLCGNDATLVRDPAAVAERFLTLIGSADLHIHWLTLRGGLAPKGGAIRVGSDAALYGDRLRLEANEATGGGGAIYSRGETELNFVTLEGNLAANGGAISADLGSLDIVNSTFVENRADNRGGAVVAWSNLEHLSVRNSTFSENEAFRGGAIFRTGVASPLPDTVSQVTFKGNRRLSSGDGAALYLAGATAFELGKSALHSDAPNALCAWDLGGPTSLGHNAATDASCALTHVDDHPAASFSLSELVDHGAFTQVHIPTCGAGGGSGSSCSVLIDQYPCGGVAAGPDQRGVNRATFSGAYVNDPNALCDIGTYESICHTARVSGDQLSTMIYTDQYKRDGNILNSGACAGVGAVSEFPAGQTSCEVKWLVYFSPAEALKIRRIWFLEDSCSLNCRLEPERCRDECTLDPTNWKAPLPALGFDVPTWETPPDGGLVTLELPGCELPATRYVMEFADGVVDFWDPEIVISTRTPD